MIQWVFSVLFQAFLLKSHWQKISFQIDNFFLIEVKKKVEKKVRQKHEYYMRKAQTRSFRCRDI